MSVLRARLLKVRPPDEAHEATLEPPRKRLFTSGRQSQLERERQLERQRQCKQQNSESATSDSGNVDDRAKYQ